MSVDVVMKKANVKSVKRKVLKTITIVLLLVVAIAGTYIGLQYRAFQQAVTKMNEQITEPKASGVTQKEVDVEPFSVLLLGVDERENDVGRSDTMIVLTVNPEAKSVKMLSIPRDTRVEIVGNDTTEKINHAYARGGVNMAIDTVENLLNIPIDYYVSVNMEGFLDLVDTLGGIEVENDMELEVNDYYFPKGEVKLNGDEALIFSRIRYEDPRGDFGRQVRQRLLIEALMGEAKDPKILLKVSDVLDVLGDNVRMNFTMSEIKAFPQLYVNLNSSIEQLQFEDGTGEMIGPLWYYIMDEEELTSISNDLRTHLELETLTSDKKELDTSTRDLKELETSTSEPNIRP